MNAVPGGVRGAAVVVLAILAGCLPDASLECADGSVCPEAQACAPSGGCAAADALAACEGLDPSAPCRLGTDLGQCQAGVCVVPNCGNGVREGAEVCDDGNNLSDDGCNGSCSSTEACGNGVVELLEKCDCGATEAERNPSCEGELNGGERCRLDCTLPRCGDGVVDPGEACDDPTGEACNPGCTSDLTCGNGIVDTAVGEQCDDGNDADTDGCTTACMLPTCGDGHVQLALGEVCDDGNTVDDATCARDCRSDATCGNGVVDFFRGETCDDGNLVSGDGCQANCRLPRCGDGIVDVLPDFAYVELCDDGNTVDGVVVAGVFVADRCDSQCASDQTCGNGVVDAGEQCDDGNVADHDGCQSSCVVQACGDGIVDADDGEQCDDGNAIDADGCTNACTLPACGR
ncbi:MAG: DUF4215 domain-containing protein [Kofleriaceae bacterium]